MAPMMTRSRSMEHVSPIRLSSTHPLKPFASRLSSLDLPDPILELQAKRLDAKSVDLFASEGSPKRESPPKVRGVMIFSRLNLLLVLFAVAITRFLFTNFVSEIYVSDINSSNFEKTHTFSPIPDRIFSRLTTNTIDYIQPIVPIAGGIDFRREARWYLGSALFGPAASTLRGGASLDSCSSLETLAQSRYNPNSSSDVTLGATTSPIEIDPANLELSDISSAFKRAIMGGAGQKGAAGEYIDKAIAKARGDSKQHALDKVSAIESMDTLQFCAAMRLFADWRIARQVPAGYKGYAVGMGLGRKDVVSNIGKIERAIKGYLKVFDGVESGDHHARVGKTPSIRELLEVERLSGYHNNNRLPRLRDNSAAIGVLWMLRQLKYQSRIYHNLIGGLGEGDSIKFVTQSYDEVYNDYHSWATRKVFNLSFQTAPPKEAIYRFMLPELVGKLAKQAQTTTATSSNASTSSDGRNPINPFVKVRNWIFRIDNKVQEEAVTWKGGAVDEQLQAHAFEQMAEFLEVVDVLLEGIDGLLEEFNMQDPTKV